MHRSNTSGSVHGTQNYGISKQVRVPVFRAEPGDARQKMNDPATHRWQAKRVRPMPIYVTLVSHDTESVGRKHQLERTE